MKTKKTVAFLAALAIIAFFVWGCDADDSSSSSDSSSDSSSSSSDTVSPDLSADGELSATCEATLVNAWGNNFQYDVTVTNTGSPLKGWAVELDFGENVSMSSSWNVKHEPDAGESAAVWEFRNCCDWNGNLDTNQSTSFGFQGTHDGSLNQPVCTATDIYDGSGSTDYPDYNTDPIEPDMSGMESTAMQMASRIKLGWNIGNTMEAIGGETNWGNPRITNELIQIVKRSGFDAIRIPASWDQYANQTTAKIDDAWLDRVKEVVQMCMDNDMPTILNIHWDGGWLENNVTPDKQEVNNAKQKAFWQQIATHLRDFDGRLMFASANEPNVETAEQMQVLLTYHQTFINAVRETGGRNAYRILVVQGPNTDIERTNELMLQMPTDTVQDRMMAEVHFYTPYQFTLMTNDAEWGSQFFYWGEGNHSTTDPDHNPTWGEEDWVTSLMEMMKAKFFDRGIPVVLGEFSAMRRTDTVSGENLELHLRSRDAWHEHVTRECLANGLLPFYWDAGGLGNNSAAIFDRDNNTVFDTRTLNALKAGAGK